MPSPIVANPPPGRRWLKPMAAGLWLLAASGCSLTGPDPSPAEVQEQLDDFSARGGYSPKQDYTTASLRETWTHGRTPLDISFVAPEAPGGYPLIVYLPGLGEDAAAGSLWRQAWAKAGYAVLTVQPATAADALKASGPGKDADLHGIGRQYFSQAALESRLAQLDWALGEFRRLSRMPHSPYASADPTRLAVAGYELGSQTAAALAGETIKAQRPDFQGLSFRAAIVLSPSTDLAAGNLAKRFSNIAMPLLAVTGSEDDDPYGISSPSLRPAIWRYAGGGDKYLLLLQNGTHKLLAGAALDKARDEAESEAAAEGLFGGWMGSSPQGGDKLLPASQYGGGQRPGGHSGGPPGEPRPYRSPEGRMPDFRHLAAVRDITTAFLDATVKADSAARQWLNQSANRWLGRSGVLKAK